MYIFLGVIFGVPLGTGVALLLCGYLLNKSNNFGDSKGDLKAFSKNGFKTVTSKENVKSTTPVEGISHPVILYNMKNDNEYKTNTITNH